MQVPEELVTGPARDRGSCGPGSPLRDSARLGWAGGSVPPSQVPGEEEVLTPEGDPRVQGPG